MRSASATEYVEERDALARDWGRFMACAFPEALWAPIPHLSPSESIRLARGWNYDGLVFSGGADWGDDTRRDESEAALLDYATMKRIPAIGVCRGFQLMVARFGGALASKPRKPWAVPPARRQKAYPVQTPVG